MASLLRGIRDSKGREVAVEVGFFESAKYPTGQNVAYIAAIHEMGAPRRKIPSRPFFRNALPEIERITQTITRATIDTHTMRMPTQAVNQIGSAAAAAVQKSIVDIDRPPHAESTIARRRAAGKGRRRNKVFQQHNVLIDTGTLRRSVTWRIRSGRRLFG